MSKASTTRLKQACAIPSVGVVFLLGLPRLLGAHHRPTGFLVLLMMFNLLVAGLGFVFSSRYFKTKSGQEVLSQHQEQYRHAIGSVRRGSEIGVAAFAVGLFGMAALAPGMEEHQQLQQLISANGGGGGGGVDGGGDGDGGGCGGCGGCGG